MTEDQKTALAEKIIAILFDADVDFGDATNTRRGVAEKIIEALCPKKLSIPPPMAEIIDVVWVEGWNACCEEFFGGLKPQDPLVITYGDPGESLP